MRELSTPAHPGWEIPAEPFRVFMGWDKREPEAYTVAKRSLYRRSSWPVTVTPLMLSQLELNGLIRRPHTTLPGGQMWDEISGAPMATEFANSRFITPILAQTGWALFVDCDVVFLGDVAELFALADPDKAVMCVKHRHFEASDTKMDGQMQTIYKRKNWSSVMLFNCDHPANLGLTLDLINSKPGRDLHGFSWLEDRDIGELPAEWNWLVNVTTRPKNPKLAHFTLGGPWLPNWKRQPHDDIWLGATQDC